VEHPAKTTGGVRSSSLPATVGAGLAPGSTSSKGRGRFG
jgi:hypothetical protein